MTNESSVAAEFVTARGADLRYDTTKKKWRIWDGKRWVVDTQGKVRQELKAFLESRLDATRAGGGTEREIKAANVLLDLRPLTAILKLSQTEPAIVSRASDYDSDLWRINVRNGTLDLKTGTLGPHRREDLLTKLVDIDYVENAACPKWLAAMDLWMQGSEELVAYLQRCLGYSLTGDIGAKCFFVLFGQGSNGKSSFIQILKELTGDYGLACSPSTFMTRAAGGINNDIARLHGARAIMMSESGQRDQLDEGVIKRFTGGDLVTARFLHEEYFSFMPQGKPWLATNHKPGIKGTDRAIWGRCKLIPFEADVKALYAVRGERLPSFAEVVEGLREELSGILAWAVRGCLDWQRDGLEEPRTVKLAGSDWESEEDTLAQFFEDRLQRGKPHAKERAGDVFLCYVRWARSNAVEPIAKTVFGKEMSKRGLKAVPSNGARWYYGLSLINAA